MLLSAERLDTIYLDKHIGHRFDDTRIPLPACAHNVILSELKVTDNFKGYKKLEEEYQRCIITLLTNSFVRGWS